MVVRVTLGEEVEEGEKELVGVAVGDPVVVGEAVTEGVNRAGVGVPPPPTSPPPPTRVGDREGVREAEEDRLTVWLPLPL